MTHEDIQEMWNSSEADGGVSVLHYPRPILNGRFVRQLDRDEEVGREKETLCGGKSTEHDFNSLRIRVAVYDADTDSIVEEVAWWDHETPERLRAAAFAICEVQAGLR